MKPCGALGLKSMMKIIDNSGATLVEVIRVMRFKSSVGLGGIGDEVVCVVQRTRSGLGPSAKVKQGDVKRAVIVRTKVGLHRPDGRRVMFDDNAGVLINHKKEMLGNRLTGVVPTEMRAMGWAKIAALAPKLI